MKGIVWLIALFVFLQGAFAQTRFRNLPVVTLSVTEPVAAEGAGEPAMLVVRRSGAIDHALRVHYRVAGNARNGRDYERLDDSIVIPAGSEEATIEITPVDDELRENTERVVVQLRPAPRRQRQYRVGAVRQAIEIVDNDGPGPLPRLTLALQNPSPGPGSLFPNYVAPAQIMIVVIDGWPYTIDTIEILANGQSLGVLKNPNPGHRYVNPGDSRDFFRFKFTWSDAPAGTHTISARGITTDGRRVFAEPITVTVRE